MTACVSPPWPLPSKTSLALIGVFMNNINKKNILGKHEGPDDDSWLLFGNIEGW